MVFVIQQKLTSRNIIRTYIHVLCFPVANYYSNTTNNVFDLLMQNVHSSLLNQIRQIHPEHKN